MKNLLIIYPHWVPSNLAGVHRPRLIGNYLHYFGWKVHLLTVESEFYEEKKDLDIHRTVSPEISVYYTKARKITRPRIIGDIGLRAFKFLKKEALKIIYSQEIDFIWIPIPSFYVAILGRQLYEKTKIPYGIDYIDPWVRDISNRKNFRSRASNFIAKILEPYAVKKASLISGVSTPYYQPVLDRNFKNKEIEHVGMPYGFDIDDHKIKLLDLKYYWTNNQNIKPFIYAGAFLANSGIFVELLCEGIKKLIDLKQWDTNCHLYFAGTGNYYHKSIADYAAENKVSEYVHEFRERKPFLQILNHLSAAQGVIIIGSTEKHYTASKTFQALLSERPIFTIFHSQSSAIEIMNQANANQYTVEYIENESQTVLQQKIMDKFLSFINNTQTWQPDFSKLDKYSAKESARQLAEKLDKVLNNN